MTYQLNSTGLYFSSDGYTLKSWGTSSNSTNGYAKTPGGFIFQWGTATTSNSSNPNCLVYFPISFPSACTFVICNEAYAPGWGGTGAATNYTPYNSPTTSYFQVSGCWINTTSAYFASSLGFRWIAIGY